MRFIRQSPLHVHGLSQSHLTPPQNSDQATSRWSSFGHKQDVLARLLSQQYQLCCYSELRADLKALGYHIEHVANKSQAPNRTFDETNLAASALSSNDTAMLKQDSFGGHAIGKQISVDMLRFVHCYQPDCARFFAYLSNGLIVPAYGLSAVDADKAQYTIGLLNLNSAYLVDLRQQWWDELEQLEDEHSQKGWDLNQLLQLDLVPVAHNQLSHFFSLTRQFFGPTAEAVLRHYAPGLV